MRARSIRFVRFALSLAFLLALGDLHCAITGGASHAADGTAAAAPMRPGHECCRPASPVEPAPADDAAPCCGCKLIPSWTLTGDASPLAASPATMPLAILPAIESAPSPIATWAPPIPATGSPPGLVVLRAHGSRAPPTTV